MSYDDDDDYDFPTKPEPIRKSVLASFRKSAREAFAEQPDLKSFVLAVAQYWADEAEDAVHSNTYGSVRAIPLWPHLCEYGDNPTEGEICGDCARGSSCPYPDEWDDNGGSIQAFEAYCHESGSQEEPSSHNELPYAIARRVGDDVVVEVIGEVQRPGSLDSDYDDDEEEEKPTIERDDTWDDPRARALLAEVAAAPADDGPRRVLADYLMEKENPRGEYIALALDNRDHARRDELLAQYEERWLYDVASTLLGSTVQWSRGFPVSADMYGSNHWERGTPVWSTFERLTVHGGPSVLDPAMRALRELGPLNKDWIGLLRAIEQPWAIEKLVIDEDDQATWEKLAAAPNLPALRELVVISDEPDNIIASLPHATWWSQLQRLSVFTGESDLAIWQPRRHELTVPWFGIGQLHHDPVRVPGWELAFDRRGNCELTLRGFTPQASLEALRELLPGVQAQKIRLVPSRHYEPAAVDVERLADARVSL
jgi:uncharacterized protein (TIGR02996 family)